MRTEGRGRGGSTGSTVGRCLRARTTAFSSVSSAREESARDRTHSLASERGQSRLLRRLYRAEGRLILARPTAECQRAA